MFLETLQSLGLSPNEAKIYNALLEIKSGSIDAISSLANVHRRNTYDAVKRLVNKGLVLQVLPKKTLTYTAVHPNKLQEFLDEKVKDLQNNLPGLINKYEKFSPKQEVCVYKGVGGLKNYIQLILKEAKTLYGIGSKGSWFDPRIKNFAFRAGREWVKKKIASKIIYDFELKEHIEVIKAIGRNYKFLPKKYSTNTSVEIFGDYVVIYSGISIKELDQDITIIVLKDKTLAQDYLKWFEFMWDCL